MFCELDKIFVMNSLESCIPYQNSLNFKNALALHVIHIAIIHHAPSSAIRTCYIITDINIQYTK